MPSDAVVCAAEIAPGKACGLPERLGVTHFMGDEPRSFFVGLMDSRQPEPIVNHHFIRGRQCQTCDGEGVLMAQEDGYGMAPPCPRCVGGVEPIEDAVDE